MAAAATKPWGLWSDGDAACARFSARPRTAGASEFGVAEPHCLVQPARHAGIVLFLGCLALCLSRQMADFDRPPRSSMRCCLTAPGRMW